MKTGTVPTTCFRDVCIFHAISTLTSRRVLKSKFKGIFSKLVYVVIRVAKCAISVRSAVSPHRYGELAIVRHRRSRHLRYLNFEQIVLLLFFFARNFFSASNLLFSTLTTVISFRCDPNSYVFSLQKYITSFDLDLLFFLFKIVFNACIFTANAFNAVRLIAAD